MPARSKVAMLPDELRTELERRMAERAFSGYQELAEWLQSEGYPISDDSVQRHGAKLQRKLELLDLAGHQARALTQAGYDADIASDAMVRLLQVQLFSLLFEAEQLELNDIGPAHPHRRPAQPSTTDQRSRAAAKARGQPAGCDNRPQHVYRTRLPGNSRLSGQGIRPNHHTRRIRPSW